MSSLSSSLLAKGWLTNFAPTDQVTAKLLLDRLMLVSASDFNLGLVKQLDRLRDRCAADQECIALYAEREMEKERGLVLPFFPGSQTGRAVGDSIQPVQVNPKKPDVGSEGIIAALISKYCKSSGNLVLSHPGPNTLRQNRVRTIAIVTDFIGSGRRISEMLDAFGEVASVQSWMSYGLLEFYVLTYSGTENGMSRVRWHRLRPKVSSYIACPVIDEAFRGSELGAINLLCKTYPKKKNRFPFGFNNTGSLIAFSHGIPNNAPALFHSRAGGWKPLFEGRSTLASKLDAIATTGELLEKNSERVLGIRDAKRVLSEEEGGLWVESMLVLDAISRGARTTTKLSALTQVPIARVDEILALAVRAGWATPRNSLTRLGRREIRTARLFGQVEEEVAFPKTELYFPSQLRAK